MVFTQDFPQGRDFTWMDWAFGFRFSADGKQILFGDQHSGAGYGTFLRDLDGSPAVRLGDGDPMDLSADGKWAISRTVASPNQLMLLPTGTGEPRQLTHSNIDHLSARWLTDGEIVSVGNELGHRERSYLLDLNGNETPITPEGVRALAATSDGKYLLTINADFSQYQLFPVDGGQPQPIPQLNKDDRPFDFTPDDTAVLVRRPGRDGAIEVWRVERVGDKRTLLRSFPLPGVRAVTTGIAAVSSRDGKSFAYAYRPAISTEYLVQGIR